MIRSQSQTFSGCLSLLSNAPPPNWNPQTSPTRKPWRTRSSSSRTFSGNRNPRTKSTRSSSAERNSASYQVNL